MPVYTPEELMRMREENMRKAEEEKAMKSGKRAPNYSYENTKVSKKEMSDLISSARKWSKFPPCKDDTEVLCRIEKFWDTCEETGEIPTWTNFCMCLGADISTVDKWEKGKGCSKERSHLISTQRDMFRTIHDTLALNGRTNNISYIWQSKQFWGYREPTNKIEIEQKTPLAELPDIAEVEARYLSLIPRDALVEPEDIDNDK